jgi:hypothetical protein
LAASHEVFLVLGSWFVAGAILVAGLAFVCFPAGLVTAYLELIAWTWVAESRQRKCVGPRRSTVTRRRPGS